MATKDGVTIYFFPTFHQSPPLHFYLVIIRTTLTILFNGTFFFVVIFAINTTYFNFNGNRIFFATISYAYAKHLIPKNAKKVQCSGQNLKAQDTHLSLNNLKKNWFIRINHLTHFISAWPLFDNFLLQWLEGNSCLYFCRNTPVVMYVLLFQTNLNVSYPRITEIQVITTYQNSLCFDTQQGANRLSPFWKKLRCTETKPPTPAHDHELSDRVILRIEHELTLWKASTLNHWFSTLQFPFWIKSNTLQVFLTKLS